MNQIYRGECKRCGAVSPVKTTGRMALRLESGEVVPLPGVGETMTLEEIGCSPEEIADRKRLVRVSNVICDTCGHNAERFEAREPDSIWFRLGILVVSFALTLPLFYAPVADHFSPRVARVVVMLVGAALFAGLLAIYKTLLKRLVRDAQQLLPPPPTCPHCAEGKYIVFEKASRKPTICQQCGKPAVKYICCGPA